MRVYQFFVMLLISSALSERMDEGSTISNHRKNDGHAVESELETFKVKVQELTAAKDTAELKLELEKLKHSNNMRRIRLLNLLGDKCGPANCDDCPQCPNCC